VLLLLLATFLLTKTVGGGQQPGPLPPQRRQWQLELKLHARHR